MLSKEERLRILRTVAEDEEFRHALMGALGYSELLSNLEKIWKEIEEIKREQAKIWEEIKSLREETKRLREEQVKIWEEIKDLKEGQEKIRKELEEVRRMQERYCTTLEEEARDVVGYFLRERGLAVELGPLQLDREYEFDIYGAAPGITVIGEAKVRAGAAQLERFAQRAEEAVRRWPEKFQGKVVKVFYCMQGAPGLEEAARRLGVWLIVANRQVTQPGV